MANFAFTVSKGRTVEFYYRARNNDPSTSGLILVPLSVSGTQAEAQAYDTLTQVLAGVSDPAGGSWPRKTLTDAATSGNNVQLAAFPAPDDTQGRYDVSIPQVTWTAPSVGQNISGMLVCYAPDTAGADTTIIPISHHDLVFAADGTNFVLNSSVFWRAT